MRKQLNRRAEIYSVETGIGPVVVLFGKAVHGFDTDEIVLKLAEAKKLKQFLDAWLRKQSRGTSHE